LYKKYPQVWFGDRIADMAKNIGITDIAKIAAIVGMTIIVKKVIETSEELSEEVQIISRGAPFGVMGIVGSFIFEAVSPQFKAQKIEVGPDWLVWVVSFCLAYIIVEHFGSIMHATGNILTSVKGLMSALLVGGGTVG